LAYYASDAASPNKFQGKRTTLDVKMPNLEEPEESTQIDPANVVSILRFGRRPFLTPLFQPFVPDLYQSGAKSAEIAAEKAGTKLPGDVPLPKVVTASAESTLPGVSSNIFQKSEDIKAFVGTESKNNASEPASKLKGIPNSLANMQIPGLGSLGSFAAGTSSQSESDASRKELDQNDIQGLYILLGIVGGGWLLGRLLEKKGTHSAKHDPTH
jgi:hypothetical protein